MLTLSRTLVLLILGATNFGLPFSVWANTDTEWPLNPPVQANRVPLSTYVLGDSLGYGLQLAGLEEHCKPTWGVRPKLAMTGAAP